MFHSNFLRNYGFTSIMYRIVIPDYVNRIETFPSKYKLMTVFVIKIRETVLTKSVSQTNHHFRISRRNQLPSYNCSEIHKCTKDQVANTTKSIACLSHMESSQDPRNRHMSQMATKYLASGWNNYKLLQGSQHKTYITSQGKIHKHSTVSNLI